MKEFIEDLILTISMVLSVAALLILLSSFSAKAGSSAMVTAGIIVIGPIATPTEPEYSDAVAIPTVPDDGSVNY